MPKILGPRASIDSLKKDAKRWLKALDDGDAAALARLRAAWPGAPDKPVLREVHHAMAREHGFANWADLKDALDARALARLGREALAELLLGSAWDSGDQAAAARIARHHPEIAHLSIHTAVAFGDIDEVRRRLQADPAQACAKGGALGWEPLLYLAYSRLPVPAVADNAIDLAALLIDHGADPNANFNDGWDNPFAVLTGVIGLGEGVRPPHPSDRALAAYLIARGAEPFDTQALYNSSIVGDDTYWLDVLWEACVAQGREALWSEPEGRSVLGGALKPNALDYLLGNAVTFHHPARTEWLLAHGADPDGRNFYRKRRHHAMAQLHGFMDIAAILERHGAQPVRLPDSLAFHAACMRFDEAEARRLAAAHPAFLQDPSPLLYAAQQDRVDIIRLLLDLGMPADLEGPKANRALIAAAHSGALAAAKLLIDEGADVDRRGGDHTATPLGCGTFWQNQAMIDLIAPLSRDVHALTAAPRLDRLRVVLAEQPTLANLRNPRGVTPLFGLPSDEEDALQAAEILLAAGADAKARNGEDETPDTVARRRGLTDAADMLLAELIKGGSTTSVRPE